MVVKRHLLHQGHMAVNPAPLGTEIADQTLVLLPGAETVIRIVELYISTFKISQVQLLLIGLIGFSGNHGGKRREGYYTIVMWHRD